MSDISINSGNIEIAISELVNKIQTEIIDASSTSGNTIVSVVENSSGVFISSFKEEVSNEVAVLHSVGELLIAMANYIQSAANAFAYIDKAYDTTKV